MASRKKKKNASELRKDFTEKAWEALWSYMDRLTDPEVIAKADSKASAGVVKTLLESIDRAQGNITEEVEEIEIPEIPEKAIEEAMRICFPQIVPSAPAPRTRRTGTRVPDRPAAPPPA